MYVGRPEEFGRIESLLPIFPIVYVPTLFPPIVNLDASYYEYIAST